MSKTRNLTPKKSCGGTPNAQRLTDEGEVVLRVATISSTWLFLGQLAASAGFAFYSFLLENWVFLAANLLLVVNALHLGQWVTLRNQRAHPPRAATARH